jgi:acyl carrier protein
MGVPGELYIGGICVARGYLNRPELTAERFVEDRFGPRRGGRLYRTGDLARRGADGIIEYLGRNDTQVKLRGVRIELGEIESVLLACGGVLEAAVIVREDAPGDQRLVAYVVGEGILPQRLREHMQSQLADHMVPSAYVQLEALPLTTSGKLDRLALPVPGHSAVIAQTYEAPRGEAEQLVASIWQELLGVERVGRHDDFFELGGHSLLVTQCIARIRKALGVNVPMMQFFAAATPAKLAQAITAEELAQFAAEDIQAVAEDIDSLSEEELRLLLQRERDGISG